MASADDFRRVDLGNSAPNFQGQRDNAQGPVEHQYERFDTARADDPSAGLSSSTWRPNQQPDELLDELARQAGEMISAKQDLDAVYGLTAPIAGPGVHTWLRDSHGYGNQEPDGEAGRPFK